MAMRYRLICYNRSTDRAGGLIDVPGQYAPRVVKIAGIQNERELGEVELTSEQVRDIAKLIPFRPDLSRFLYHLEPIGP
jgi:hypothetical protein